MGIEPHAQFIAPDFGSHLGQEGIAMLRSHVVIAGIERVGLLVVVEELCIAERGGVARDGIEIVEDLADAAEFVAQGPLAYGFDGGCLCVGVLAEVVFTQEDIGPG